MKIFISIAVETVYKTLNGVKIYTLYSAAASLQFRSDVTDTEFNHALSLLPLRVYCAMPTAGGDFNDII